MSGTPGTKKMVQGDIRDQQGAESLQRKEREEHYGDAARALLVQLVCSQLRLTRSVRRGGMAH